MKIREPRYREKFMDAAEAATRLEQAAAELRRRIQPGDQVRWELKMWYWNEAWHDPNRTFDLDHIVTQRTMHSGTPPDANLKPKVPNEPI